MDNAGKYTLICTVSLLILAAMTYSFFMGNRMINKHAPLIDAAMEIKLEATTAHLWFEEIISGDRHEKIETIITHIDQAIWYAQAMLEGGENSEGTFLPLEDIRLRNEVTSVVNELKAFKELTTKRYEAHETSGVGTVIDQKYDSVFNSFINQADHVETLLQEKIRAEYSKYKVIQTALIIIVVVLGCLVIIMQRKYDRRHRESMARISKEIEERKGAEERLRESHKLKDEFIATASHELRTPLTVLLGYSELLLSYDNLSDEARHNSLKSINTKASVLNRIVDEFLDVSRMESGIPIHIECSPVKISDVAHEVVQQQEVGKEPRQFKVTFDDEQLEVYADNSRLHQIFENLISNAIKYSSEGSQIESKGEEVEGKYKVSIIDEGIGMNPEQQKNVFQKYYRADPSDTSVKGLGIGLYFVKNIIELHNGQIWFESNHGRGSKFFFTLPLNSSVT